jgi:aspartyl-tRNA synthetase
MVTEYASEIIVGMFTLSAALAGSYLQYRQNVETQQMSIRAENKRTSADYLLQKEADALMELLESAERCHHYSHQYVNYASTQGEVSDELAREATEALAEFESAVRTKSVFLDEDDQEAVQNLLGSVRTAMASGDHHIRDESDIAHELIDWQALIDDFEELRKVLEELVQERINELRK